MEEEKIKKEIKKERIRHIFQIAIISIELLFIIKFILIIIGGGFTIYR